MSAAFDGLSESCLEAEERILKGEIPSYTCAELNDEIKIDLKNHDYGGVILFGENFEDARQVVNIISDIQNVNQANGGLPLFVTVDQEGGTVARISFGTVTIHSRIAHLLRDYGPQLMA